MPSPWQFSGLIHVAGRLKEFSRSQRQKLRDAMEEAKDEEEKGRRRLNQRGKEKMRSRRIPLKSFWIPLPRNSHLFYVSDGVSALAGLQKLLHKWSVVAHYCINSGVLASILFFLFSFSFFFSELYRKVFASLLAHALTNVLNRLTVWDRGKERKIKTNELCEDQSVDAPG